MAGGTVRRRTGSGTQKSQRGSEESPLVKWLLIGIALLFVRNVTRSLYVLGGLFLLLVPTCIVVSSALFMPLVDIIEKMQQ